VEKQLNNLFKFHDVSAVCVEADKIGSYIYFDCYLKENGKICSILKIENEIMRFFNFSNINIKVLPEDSVIRIESILEKNI